MSRTSTSTKVLDSAGNTAGVDVWAGYRAADIDQNPGSTSYYGFVDSEGNWYIMKQVDTGVLSTYTFAVGTSDYSTNWTNRASLSYATFDNVV